MCIICRERLIMIRLEVEFKDGTMNYYDFDTKESAMQALISLVKAGGIKRVTLVMDNRV